MLTKGFNSTLVHFPRDLRDNEYYALVDTYTNEIFSIFRVSPRQDIYRSSAPTRAVHDYALYILEVDSETALLLSI